MFTLSGAISWVGKQAQLNANSVSLQEGQQLIAQAITEWCIEARGCGHPHLHPPALPPFSFHNQDEPPWEERLQSADKCWEVLRHTHWVPYHEWGCASQWGQDHSQQWWDLWAALTLTPSPDHGFKSDGSSVSTSSSMSSRSDRSRGSRHQQQGWCCQEPGGHMKINLPIFKNDNKKDAITYQSWHWDIMVYHQAGCWDGIPYMICSLQGYLGELVRSLATDITLVGVISVLDEHYSNVKAMGTLNQEFFQLWMANKETVSDCGYACQGTSKSLWPHSWKGSHQTKLLNWIETTSTVGYLSSWRWWWPTLKATSNEKTYSDYLQVAQEAER